MFENPARIPKRQQQAGAELCQAQVKLDVKVLAIDEDGVGVIIGVLVEVGVHLLIWVDGWVVG